MGNLRESLLVFVRGVLMGMADIVPGVSGGTVALITGIYERLIFAIRGVNATFLAHLLKGDLKRSRESLMKMDLGFLLTLGLGIGIAFMLLSGVIRFFMSAYPANTYAFFFGLILASAGFVYRNVGGIDARTVTSAACGFAFAFLLTGMGTLQSSHSMPVIFFSGIIAICAMILPGISGAFIMFFLGQYEYMLGALHSLDLPVIAVFMAGALTGLFGMARVLGYLLRRHKPVTMAFLVGLMLGALRLPYQNVVSNEFQVPLVLASGAAGLVIVVALERSASRFQPEKTVST